MTRYSAVSSELVLATKIIITNTGGTVASLADLQVLANHTGTVTFANGSSLSLFG